MYLVHTCLGEAHWPRCRARTQPVVEAAGEKGGSGEGWSGEEGLLLSLAGSKELKPADWKILKRSSSVTNSFPKLPIVKCSNLWIDSFRDVLQNPVNTKSF